MINRDYHWYALKTSYQSEFRCLEFLENQEIDCFTPWKYTYRAWSDRTKRVKVACFPQYIFVRISCVELPLLNCCKPHVGLVRNRNEPDKIPERIVEGLKLIKDQTDIFHFLNSPLRKGQIVQVIEGPFIGLEAEVHGLNGTKKVIVRIGKGDIAVQIPVHMVNHINKT